ncbi:carbonic anhydrase 2-like [Asterias rubens]|uniref:carbonic anhydrase 2-like n=1 Tax=Asterias rubens TaxID=7604 RepID=UPI0014558CE8|nr:carbonic anhydrase 2-like [Asterias rubens]
MEMKMYSYIALFVSAVLLFSSLQVDGASWSYVIGEENGPDNWDTVFPDYCSKSKQSPINIVSKSAEHKPIGDFTLVGFGSTAPTDARMKAENNGHTVEVELTSGNYFVSEGGLSAPYKAAQFHFHWGNVNTVGSEHTVDGKQYPAEVHIVCYNTKQASVAEAAGTEDGLTVLGFLIDIQDEDNPAFAPLFDALSGIQFHGDHEDLATPLIFGDILPSNLSSFYRYSGSLTTPTCNEVVVWNVFTNPILISQAQMDMFRSLNKNELGDAVNETYADTFRPVQPLNGRTVYLNDLNALPRGSGSLISPVTLGSVVAFVLATVLLK